MKAKEYFDAYSSRILPQNEDSKKAVISMFNDMDEEFKALIKARHIQKLSSLQALVREVNTKWNVVASLFEKKGCPMVKRNGFSEVYDMRIQEATAHIIDQAAGTPFVLPDNPDLAPLPMSDHDE